MSSNRKKLLILYTKNPNEVYNRRSAIGSYVHCLADLLAEDFEVTLNCKNVGYVPNENLNPQITSSNFSKLKKLVPKRVKSYLRDKQHLVNLEELKQQISDLNITFDAVLEFYNFGSDVGLSLSKKFKCHLHLIYDGPIFEEYAFFNGHKSWFENRCRELEKKSFEQAKSIVVYSQPMVDFCTKNIHADQSKYKIHQNVDFSRFHLFEGKKEFSDVINICFVGSFLKWHRVDLLLKAVKEINLASSDLNFHLHLIGDGVERAAMESLSQSLKLDKITFHGYKDGEELTTLQKRMHIGVMPGSNWYGAPNKIFEYGAMKMAVVSPKTQTIKDLFGEDEVYFFENGDLDSLRKALLQVARNQEERDKKGGILMEKVRTKYSEKNTSIFYTSLLIDSSLV